ncbi:MAG: hypothetical protein NVS2B14_04590 [Chamaesiphon sp.]
MQLVPNFQQSLDNSPNLNLYFSWLIFEILDLQILFPQGRINPIVVKKTHLKLNSKKRFHKNNETFRKQLSFLIS